MTTVIDKKVFEQIYSYVITGKIHQISEELKNNSNSIFAFICQQETINELVNDDTKALCVISLMSFYLPMLRINGETTNILRVVWRNYITNQVIIKYRADLENFINKLFNFVFIKYAELTEEAITLFTRIESLYKNNSFTYTKAFLCYYAYRTKNYSICQDFLNKFLIRIGTSDYTDHYNFALMNYFKGIIFLSKEQFNEAAIFFCISLTSRPFSKGSDEVYTYHQIESIKRICFLVNLVSTEYQHYISSVFGMHQEILNCKALDGYNDLRKITGNNKATYSDYLRLLKDFKNQMEAEKVLVSC